MRQGIQYVVWKGGKFLTFCWLKSSHIMFWKKNQISHTYFLFDIALVWYFFSLKRYCYVKPKVKTNNPRKKITKYEYYQRLRSWQFRRAKGLEEWNKKERPKTRGSKYKKYQVFASIFKTAVSRVNNPLVTHCVKGTFTYYVTQFSLYFDHPPTHGNAFTVILLIEYHTRLCNSNTFADHPPLLRYVICERPL